MLCCVYIWFPVLLLRRRPICARVCFNVKVADPIFRFIVILFSQSSSVGRCALTSLFMGQCHRARPLRMCTWPMKLTEPTESTPYVVGLHRMAARLLVAVVACSALRCIKLPLLHRTPHLIMVRVCFGPFLPSFGLQTFFLLNFCCCHYYSPEFVCS